jgi:hypothetical protein
MVQIKDSVLRESRLPPGLSPALNRRTYLRDAASAILRGFGRPASGSGRMSAPRFGCRLTTAIVNNLSTTCQECCMSLIDAGFSGLQKSVEIFGKSA